eukprot:4820168-Ditylum_brightwellii.AAC.1
MPRVRSKCRRRKAVSRLDNAVDETSCWRRRRMHLLLLEQWHRSDQCFAIHTWAMMKVSRK